MRRRQRKRRGALRGALAAGLLLAAGCGAARTAPLAAGQRAPDFTLLDQHRNEVTLSSLRGSNVVLAFYVLAFTGG